MLGKFMFLIAIMYVVMSFTSAGGKPPTIQQHYAAKASIFILAAYVFRKEA